MNRADLHQLSEMRLSDAKQLLASGVNDAGAYYMAGYAVECALKACIAKLQGVHPFPPRLRWEELNQKYYTHSVETLLETAGLKPRLQAAIAVNPTLGANWALIATWNEGFRYEPRMSRRQVEDLIAAIEDPQNGVMTWLKSHW